jgi:excisionase family DNA binding protein
VNDEKLGQLLGPQALAEYLGVPVKTVYQWRYRNLGPRGIRVGRHVRYRRADVDSWLERQADPTKPAA